MSEPKHPHPWLFALTGMPYGVVGSFSSAVMTYLTREAGVDVGNIGWYFTLLMVPTFVQFLYAPIVDIGPRRKHWLMIVTAVGAACIFAACVTPLPDHIELFLAFAFAGQLISGLVGACNGGLLATTMPDHLRGKASGALNIGNLCGGGLSASIAVYMTGHHFAPWIIGLVLAGMMILPSFAVLAVVEPKREKRPAAEVFRGTLRDVGDVLFSKMGFTGILLFLSPVGTAALSQYFNAMGVDYVRSEVATVIPDPTSVEVAARMLLIDLGEAKDTVTTILTDVAISERVSDVLVIVTGTLGIALTAVGAYVGGWLCDRTNRRAMYLLSAVMTAACGVVMALSPRTETTFFAGALVYQLITGFCYAAFTATVLETIGKAGKAASTQYTLFVAAGNGAITWVTLVDTRFHEKHGVEGVVWSDALLNIAGVVVLAVVFVALGTFGKSRHKPPTESALPTATVIDRD